MQGDFTKLTFHPKQRDSRIYLQQGRVQLDADWNNQVDLFTHALRQGICDLVGDYGAPSSNPGFDIVITAELLFDGIDDFINVGRRKKLYFQKAEPFTIEISFTPCSGEHRGGTLVSCYDIVRNAEDQRGGYLLRISETGCAELHRFRRDGSLVVVKAQSPCQFDSLNHLAATFDGRSLALYVNGFLVGRRSNAGEAPDYLPTFLMGARLRDHKPGDFFCGTFEDVRIWQTCRSGAQIRMGKDVPPQDKAPGLVAWWPINEAEGNVIVDTVSSFEGIFGSGRVRSAPSWAGRRLRVGGGRYYVGGIRCESLAPFYYSRQPDLPNAEVPPGLGQKGTYLVYLDVWERLVTAMDEPEIAEPALSGIDSSVRVRVVHQVRLLPVTVRGKDPEQWPEWKDLMARSQSRGQMSARYDRGPRSPKNQLYRVEIHCAGGVYGLPEQRDTSGSLVITSLMDENCVRTESRAGVPALTAGQLVEIYTERGDGDNKKGDLAVIVATNENELKLHPFPDELTLQDKPKIRAIAGFKWSRDNGSRIWPIQSVETDSDVIILDDAGREAHLLEEGAWVELLDNQRVLNPRNESLLQLGPISDPVRLVCKGDIPFDLDPAGHPRMRLWDQRVESETGLLAGLVPVTDDWTELEDGIQVRFEARTLLSPLDYWLIPARTQLEEGLDWPREFDGQPLPQPPHGINHSYAPLALIQGGSKTKITDLRRVFGSITSEGEKPKKKTPPQPAPLPSLPTLPDEPFLLPDATLLPDLDPSVPKGCIAFSTSKTSPPGFQSSGLTLKAEPWSSWPLPPPHEGRGRVVFLITLFGRIFCFFQEGDVLAYDPEDGDWSLQTRVPAPCTAFGCTALNGQIFVIGGLDAQGNHSDLNQVYDPASNTWSEGKPMPSPRAHLCVAAAGGMVIAAGGCARPGFADNGVSGKVEIYDPATNEWYHGAALPTPRSHAVCAVVDGQIHTFAGYARKHFGFGGQQTRAHEIYDPERDEWSCLGPMPVCGAYLQAAAPRQGIHLIDAAGLHHFSPTTTGRFTGKEPGPALGTGFLLTADSKTLYLIDSTAETGYRYQLDSLLHLHTKADD